MTEERLNQEFVDLDPVTTLNNPVSELRLTREIYNFEKQLTEVSHKVELINKDLEYVKKDIEDIKKGMVTSEVLDNKLNNKIVSEDRIKNMLTEHGKGQIKSWQAWMALIIPVLAVIINILITLLSKK